MKKIMLKSIIFSIIASILLTFTYASVSAQNVNLSDPVFNFDKILFIKKQFTGLSMYMGSHMCGQNAGFNQLPGGGLFVLENCFSSNPTVRNVLENSLCTNGRYEGKKLEGGSFSSPDLSYDGTQVVFAYTDAVRSDYYPRAFNETTTYHIFKVNIDGTNLTELTDGVYNDFDPVWLPDGRILFISERRGGVGRCHPDQRVTSYNLTSMNADGSDIRVLSYHETNEWAPSVDNDGMILYTRWDYVDRGDTQMHSAWITTPDGQDPRQVVLNYSNYSNNPLMQINLRAIPDSNKIVGIAAAHHAQSYGSVIMIDPDIEDDDNLATIKRITTDAGFPEGGVGQNQDMKYGTPWPLSEEYFLVAYDPNANENGDNKKYSLYAIDSSGNKTKLYEDPGTLSCQDPIPLRARPMPNAYPSTKTPNGASQDGIVSVTNVYNSLLPFPEGTQITALRIIQLYPKTTEFADYAKVPPKISYVERKNTRGVLGTVPVESDGSAQFYLPPNKPVLFQALDQNGVAVQTMRSDVFIVGGQTRMTCGGCHEPNRSAPGNPSTVPIALRRTPSTITPDPAPGARPMSFPRLIQPVLDSKCISCHNGTQTPDLRKGTPDENGWFVSYNSLKNYVQVFPDITWGYPRSTPGQFGSNASSLYTRLKNGHGNLTSDELHRFVLWMDTGVAPFFGVYEYDKIEAQQNGEQVEPSLE